MIDQLYSDRSGLRNHLMMIAPPNDPRWFMAIANLAAVADPTTYTPSSFNNISVPSYMPVGARLTIAAGNQGTMADVTIDIVGLDCFGIRVEDSIRLRTDQADTQQGCVGFTSVSFARVDGIRLKSITAAANDALSIGYPLPIHKPYTSGAAPTAYQNAPGVGPGRVFQFPHGGDWTFIDQIPYAELTLDTGDANALNVADGDRLIVTDEQKTVRWEITAGAAAAGHEKLDLTAWVTAGDARDDIIEAIQSHHGWHVQLLTVGKSGHAIVVDDKEGLTHTFMLGTAASPEYTAVTIGGSAAATATNLGAAITAAVAAGQLGAHLTAKVVGDVVRVFSNRADLKDSAHVSIYANDEDVAAPLVAAPSFQLTRHRWGVTPYKREEIERHLVPTLSVNKAQIWLRGGTLKTFIELVREAAGVYSLIASTDFSPRRELFLDPLGALAAAGSVSPWHGDLLFLEDDGTEDLYEFDDQVKATIAAAVATIDIATGPPTSAQLATRTVTAINTFSTNTWRAAASGAGTDGVVLVNAPATANVYRTEGNSGFQYGEPEMLGYRIRAPHFWSTALHIEFQGLGAHSGGAHQSSSAFEYFAWDLIQMAGDPQPGIHFQIQDGSYASFGPRAHIWDNLGLGGEPNTVAGGMSAVFLLQTLREPEESRRPHRSIVGMDQGRGDFLLGAEAQRLGNRAGGSGVSQRMKIGLGRKTLRR